MNYGNVYRELIGKAVERGWSRSTATCYVESHHIIPRCLGGLDSPDNIVCLTAKEHFVAHLLLAKMHPLEDGLIYAAQMMLCGGKNHKRVSGRTFQWLKERRAAAVSARHKGIAKSDQHKQNMRGKRPHVNQTGSNNNAFKGLVQTPVGVFESLKQAAAAEGVDISVVHYRIHSKSDKFTEYKRLPL